MSTQNPRSQSEPQRPTSNFRHRFLGSVPLESTAAMKRPKDCTVIAKGVSCKKIITVSSRLSREKSCTPFTTEEKEPAMMAMVFKIA